MTTSINQFIVILSSIFILGTITGISTQAYADQKPGQHKYRKDNHRSAHPGNRYDRYRKDYHRPAHPGKRYGHMKHSRATVIHHGPGRHAPANRGYSYRNIHVVRHHGPMYRGYGHYLLDSDAYPWLAFTAITLKVLDNVNENQQRAHEAAQVRAASAPVGESITWNDGRASGSVTTVRDGISTSGRYCREFQHQVTVAGKKGQAYGTACRQPDGSWEVISSGAP